MWFSNACNLSNGRICYDSLGFLCLHKVLCSKNIRSEEEFVSVFSLSIRTHTLNWKLKNLYSVF